MSLLCRGAVRIASFCYFVGALIVTQAASSAESIFSTDVGLVGDGQTLYVNADDGWTVLGFVGEPFTAHIQFYIGWLDCPSEGGTCSKTNSMISQPEFAYFWKDDKPCSLPTGLTFDGNAGKFSGIPYSPGGCTIYPSVRDVVNGEHPYTGHGAWRTVDATLEGKRYDESKNPAGILIVPRPDLKKQVHLRCTRNATDNIASKDFLLNIDYDIGYIEVLGNTGKIAGFYRIDPEATTLSWPSLAGDSAQGITLDRTSGALTMNYGQLGQVSGQCIKRSAVTQF